MVDIFIITISHFFFLFESQNCSFLPIIFALDEAFRSEDHLSFETIFLCHRKSRKPGSAPFELIGSSLSRPGGAARTLLERGPAGLKPLGVTIRSLL